MRRNRTVQIVASILIIVVAIGMACNDKLWYAILLVVAYGAGLFVGELGVLELMGY